VQSKSSNANASRNTTTTATIKGLNEMTTPQPYLPPLFPI